MRELPPGWDSASLTDIVGAGLFSDGDWVESKNQDPAGDVRLLQLADIGEGQFRDRSDRHLTSASAGALGCTYLEAGDVLVARMSDPLGRACRVPKLDKPSVTAVDVCILRPTPIGVDPSWLMWAINSPQVRSQIATLQSGTTRKRISRKNLGTVRLAVPPRPEQERIVAALEEHLSRLDAAEASLRSAELKTRIAERAAAEALIEGSGPLRPIEEFASQARNSLAIGPFGSNLKVSDYQGEGVPLVFVRDIRQGKFGGEGTRYVSAEKAAALANHITRTGDVLVTKMGDPPGDAAVYRGKDAVITADCIKLTPAANVDARFIVAALGTRRAKSEILSITRGVAQKKVSLGRFRTSVFLPKPPLQAQARLASQVEELTEVLRRARRAAATSAMRASALRRSILAAAFSGQLVPQDPDDEPVSVLLERIRAQRAAAALKKRGRRAKAS